MLPTWAVVRAPGGGPHLLAAAFLVWETPGAYASVLATNEDPARAQKPALLQPFDAAREVHVFDFL